MTPHPTTTTTTHTPIIHRFLFFHALQSSLTVWCNGEGWQLTQETQLGCCLLSDPFLGGRGRKGEPGGLAGPFS